ncbi:MAG: PLP-dependent aspartate aminotransferase family protein [Gemmatimonadaceae bacterium]|nr:PLP-dependent aspartate aminotransferase family protein [Gemmatimonadaceae bacterium]
MPETLSRRLAALEGAESALVLASGMAATACTMLALLRSGDHLVAGTWLRPDTRRFCEQALPALGVQVTFVDPLEGRAWRRGLTKTTRALFVETPVLATTRVVDLRAPRMLAQELGLALIVDATAATPINCTPIALGADVVIHDARHLLAGDDRAEIGVACGTESLIDEVRAQMQLWGAVPHPSAVATLAQGVSTLDVRIRRQNANAQAVAEWATHSPAVSSVLWPGSATHPDHALAAEQLHGFGSTVVLTLTDADLARRAVGAPESNGDGALTTHIVAGETPTQIRVVVGVESADAALAWLATRLP